MGNAVTLSTVISASYGSSEDTTKLIVLINAMNKTSHIVVDIVIIFFVIMMLVSKGH
jgi:hypothetical protein